jgi:hypothetical protein
MAGFEVNWNPLKIGYFERFIVAEKIYLQPMVRFRCDFALLEGRRQDVHSEEEKIGEPQTAKPI